MFLSLLGLVAVRRRFWCRYLCPLFAHEKGAARVPRLLLALRGPLPHERHKKRRQLPCRGSVRAAVHPLRELHEGVHDEHPSARPAGGRVAGRMDAAP
ncbi:MAG: 4Fe-4S binding protein [Endomicrobiales bacterium]